MKPIVVLIAALGFASAVVPVAGVAQVTTVDHLQVTQGNYIIHDFRFADGETLPELRMHYRTLGQPARNAAGEVTNAVLIMHGTGGSGAQFLTPHFADVLFQPGELLAADRYYIILPDDIGHGGSSKPSDGLRMRFPHYAYADMVRAEYLLVTQGLHVNHLRLVMGTSMGCMHTWMWGERWPTFMDALMPLACLPARMAGRNWMWREMMINAIEADPAWDHGNYTAEPRAGLTAANDLLLMVVADPHHWRALYPTPEAAAAFLQAEDTKLLAHEDANDMIYQFDSSRDYDPAPELRRIVAPVMAINSADDQVNPVGLDKIVMKAEMPKVKHGRFVLIPVSEQTHGHSTHTWAAVWNQWLWKLLQESAPARKAP